MLCANGPHYGGYSQYNTEDHGLVVLILGVRPIFIRQNPQAGYQAWMCSVVLNSLQLTLFSREQLRGAYGPDSIKVRQGSLLSRFHNLTRGRA